uniref:RING-type domain-containing protein n=1 Tax=Anabas testudineus TaxID=64144 RepID=A0A3Q1HZB7_ANATE
MSAASCLLTEDQFLCSICLDVFTDPVSIPCGHNFCKDCITEYWSINVQCRCPNCNKRYNKRPELQINTFISEMAAQFRQSAQQKTSSSSSEQQDVEPEVHQMIQKRRLKIQEIKASVQLSNKDADREIAEGVQVFTALKESVERGQAELIKTIKEKQRTTEKQAEDFIKELEQEISDLNKRSSEVDIRPSSYEGAVVRAVAQLEEKLTEKMKNLFKVELKRIRQFAVNLTLDVNTAHPKLILSGSQVKHGDVKKNLPDNPERFDPHTCVLAKQSFSSGRFYYEVQVKGKTDWDVGVVRESINRKGKITANPQNGFWTICLRNGREYYAAASAAVCLSLRSHSIYSFTGCTFTEKLFPYFSPSLNYGGTNAAPLIITAVSHTE